MNIAVTFVLVSIALLTFFAYIPSLYYPLTYLASDQIQMETDGPLMRWIAHWFSEYAAIQPHVFRTAMVLLHLTIGIFFAFTCMYILRRFSSRLFFARLDLSPYAHTIALIAGTLFLLHPIQAQAIMQPTSGFTHCVLLLFMLFVPWIALFQCKRNMRPLHRSIIRTIIITILTGVTFLITTQAFLIPFFYLLISFFFDEQDISNQAVTEDKESLSLRFLTRWYPVILVFISCSFSYLMHQNAAMHSSNPIIIAQQILQATKKLTASFLFSTSSPIISYGIAFSATLLHAIQALFWPSSLSVYYEWQPLSSLALFCATIISISMGTIALWHIITRKKTILIFALMWMFLHIGAQVITNNVCCADHHMYGAMASISLLLGILYVVCIEISTPYLASIYTLTPSAEARHICATLFLLASLGITTTQFTHNWNSSLSFWHNAVTHNTQSIRANLSYGTQLAMTTNNVDQALLYLEKARTQEPKNGSICSAIAQAYMRMNNTEKAIDVLAEAIKANMLYRDGYVHLAEILVRTGKFDYAERLLQASLKFFPADGTINLYLARLLLNRKEAEKAWDHLKIACEDSMTGTQELRIAFAKLSRDLGKGELEEKKIA